MLKESRESIPRVSVERGFKPRGCFKCVFVCVFYDAVIFKIRWRNFASKVISGKLTITNLNVTMCTNSISLTCEIILNSQ
jgi:hypothetical protein